MPNMEDLKEYATTVADEFEILDPKKRTRCKMPKLYEDNLVLIRAYKLINEAVKSKGSIIAAAEWLLDNFYVVEEQVKELENTLSKDTCRDLPILSDGEYKGYARIYGIAMRICAYTDARIDEFVIPDFINRYQTITPLSSEELWALPTMLRVALIQKIRDITIFIIESLQEQKSAELWAQRLIEGLVGYKDKGNDALGTVINAHDKAIDYIRPIYAERLLHKLREEGPDSAPIIRWVDGRLAVQHTGADEIIQTAHQMQAVNQVTIGNAVTSIREITSLKWEEIFEELSLLENVLRQDPAGIYGLMDFQSRDYYRQHIEKTAKLYNLSEVYVAQKAVECALEKSEGTDEKHKHIGFYIIDKGRKILEDRISDESKFSLGRHLIDNSSFYYYKSVGILFIGLMLLFMSILYRDNSLNGILLLILSVGISTIPIISIAIGIVHFVVVRVCKPKLLPKYELKDGIPDKLKTMVVIPALLTSEKRVTELIEQMEVFYLANQEENLHFALLGDFRDGSKEEQETDTPIVESATRLIRELNSKYGQVRDDIFYYFHRQRQWNESQKRWMGWERKRGALTEFNALLLGEQDTSFSTKIGDLSSLENIVYIITLDADTQLPRDAARKLIGAIAHPLNAPLLNEDGTRVAEGHGLLQPRIGVSVDSASRSFFSLSFSGQTGVDPYTSAISDVYQDLFSEGIFTGKGIYHLKVFNQVLENAIPDNSVLSHDLLEGSYIRAGLATDIELIDGYPASYVAYSMRLHRWVRGDWQLLPWVRKYVKNKDLERVKNPINRLSKWKIMDNLRRSLLSPALFIMLILSLIILPGPIVAWLSLVLFTLLFPLITELANSLFARKEGNNKTSKLTDFFHSTGSLVWQIAMSFVFLAHQAWLMLDAITRTIWRLTISRVNMLEWVTAADAESGFSGSLLDYWKKMNRAILLTVLLLLIAVWINPPVLPMALLFAIVWIPSFFVAYKVSKPKVRQMPYLSDEQVVKLRMIARKTWKYFDDLVDEKSNWLPPDNYQLEPPIGLANRTSPTNIGLHLTSLLAARDFGYITTIDAVKGISKTIQTLNRMEKWKGGHFYNWYDITTLEALKPLYVSTVDNGNLIGYLVTLNQGIEELLKRPIIAKESILGLRDVLITDCGMDLDNHSMLNMFLSVDSISAVEWQMLLDDLKGQDDVLDRLIINHEKEINLFIPWVKLLEKIPSILLNERGVYKETAQHFEELFKKLNENLSLQNLYDNYLEILKLLSETLVSLRRDANRSVGFNEANGWLKQLELSLATSYSNIRGFVSKCMKVHKEVDYIIENTDFKLLYDEKRELFTIGFNAEEGHATRSYYDLLASEARQASFIAIAKGDVPQKHWFQLGRSLTLLGDLRVLISWSGTMFEYLMPFLIMRSYEYTLLDETYMAAVQAQRQYGEQRRIPWGISESGFYAFDLHLNYQYKAFGVPQLGLKRGLVNDLVIAPYATMLALPIEPVNAYKNIEALSSEGMLGRYGLYEAIDYTPERLPNKKKSVVINSFMAHHQGMSLLALDNYLNNNIMQKRFHSDPMIKATELLLQERMPRKEIYIKEHEETEIIDLEQNRRSQEIRAKRIFTSPDTAVPEANILSNGKYTVMTTNNGGGFSQYLGRAISRWISDATRDNWGMFFYVENLNSNNYWSVGHQPRGHKPEDYKVTFETDRSIYQRKDGNIETAMEVVVSPEYDGEVRRLTFVNHSSSSRVLEITSYFEVLLTSYDADNAHPAFSNLFIQTEYLAEFDTLLATRRPRSENEKTAWLLHTAKIEGEQIGSAQYETDRMKFIGRGRTVDNPQAMEPDYPLSNTVGAVLDPIVSMRKRIRIEAGESAKITYITAAAETKEGIMALVRDCYSNGMSERCFELAWTHSQVELRYLNMTAELANVFQTIASRILYLQPANEWKRSLLVDNRKGQSALWSYGISGDLPIVLVRVNKLEHIDLAKQMLTAHEYLRLKNLSFDLVILNEYGNSYEQPLQERLAELISISHARDIENKSGGVYLRQKTNIPKEDIILLMSTARLVLNGDDGALVSQMQASEVIPTQTKANIKTMDYNVIEQASVKLPEDMEFYNGIGGYSKDSREYIIKLDSDNATPMPWSNVIANHDFGFLITEVGSSYTWSKNSRENKLTPWSNDPVSDPSGEIIYVRDEQSGDFWTTTPQPIRQEVDYLVRHGHGYSIFEHISNGISHSQLMYVSKDDPVKFVRIKLRNICDQTRSISLTYYLEWILGINKDNLQYVITEFNQDLNSIIATNRYNDEFAERAAFISSSMVIDNYTGDRCEFLGRNGSRSKPGAMYTKEMSRQTGSGYDPCSAVRVEVDLEAKEEKEVLFILGQADNEDHAAMLIEKYRNTENAEQAFVESTDYWDDKLSVINVRTPDKSMDFLLNRWLIYQTYASRIMARTAFYQAGGAYGFRDQLQDVMAVVYSDPAQTRSHILLSAAHQFIEGDVQHWWHPENRGVRTKITDDLLFLPYVTSDYIHKTGDWSILNEQVSFLDDEPLGPDEHDRYRAPKVTKEKADIYNHCIRAIERSMSFGENGLPLIGGGDWNDGMDRVGIGGKGESVWLGWFLISTLKGFIPACEARGDNEKVARYRKTIEELTTSIEKNAWDGGWYRRAYFDDGTPLGSEQNEECQIDAISQSWAVISDAAKPKRVSEAMRAVQHHLIDEENGIIKLLSPPFHTSSLEPGYIKGYVPGVRENGGQYTHAAVWTVLAFTRLGDGEKASNLYNMINPINHTKTQLEINKYKAEPYVMAADVYAVHPHIGRGGWTWYTGSSAWMYRVGIEGILGFRLRGDSFTVEPCIPKGWDEYDIEYRYKSTTYRIRVTNEKNVCTGVDHIELDGSQLQLKQVPLVDDGKVHQVNVVMGTGE
ncbi:MAG TPA: glucoamylase family protein [Bacillota bacterium]|nr:glucoamylase family protein [Bacillota bacterium]